MNNILTQEEENALRKHFAYQVETKYKPKTMNAIIAAVNAVRVGSMDKKAWVNEKTKIITWLDYFENWNLLGRFISWD